MNQPPYPPIPPQPSEDGKLAALVRDMLGAKGAHDIMRGLLDSLTPERRAQLAESVIACHTFDSDMRFALATVLAETLTTLAKECSARVTEDLRAKQEAIVSKVTEEMTTKLVESVRRTVAESLRLNRW